MDWLELTKNSQILRLQQLPRRKILHFDMDCFYAQVEMRDNPKLRNVPLAIGGPPKSRSVLCTSNYLARKFNVRAAMPVDYALRLCPNLVILPPNFKKYSEISEEIFDVYRQYTETIETLSLDEAYLEISPNENATSLAKEIKDKIFKKTHLTSSGGVSYNKFLAKIASDWNKPNGLFVITPEKSYDFLTNLEIRKLPGIGPKTDEYLKNNNLKTISDIRKCHPIKLQELLGDFSLTLIDYAYGIDQRAIISHAPAKSISVEETFIKDISTLNSALEMFRDLYPYLEKRLINKDGQFFYKLVVKLKTKNFKRHTKEIILEQSYFSEINSTNLMTENLQKLAENQFSELFEKVNEPIRLLGLGFKLIPSNPFQQMCLPFPSELINSLHG